MSEGWGDRPWYLRKPVSDGAEVGKPLVVNTVKFLWTDDVLVKIFQYKRDIGNNVQLSTDCLKFSKRNSGQSVTVIVTDAELT